MKPAFEIRMSAGIPLPHLQKPKWPQNDADADAQNATPEAHQPWVTNCRFLSLRNHIGNTESVAQQG